MILRQGSLHSGRYSAVGRFESPRRRPVYFFLAPEDTCSYRTGTYGVQSPVLLNIVRKESVKVNKRFEVTRFADTDLVESI